jgi:hypothetical protein
MIRWTSLGLLVRQHRLYWAVRYALQRMQFVLASTKFGFSEGFRGTIESASILGTLFRSVLFPAIAATCVAILIQFIGDSWWPLTLLRDDPDPQTYDVLMGVIASVTGIFLAIYFAAVSTVAGAVYARVPNDVRELMVRDKVGNIYVWMLSFLAVFAVELLGLHGLQFPALRVGLVGIVVAVVPTVFAFAHLGRRAFYFFDPTALAGVLFEELRRAVRLSTAWGYRWQDPSFQEHYRGQASRALRTLDTLIRFAQQEQVLRGRPLLALALRSLWFMDEYLQQRRRIPSDSRWFKLTARYQEWYLADSTTLQLATSTMTALSPQMEPDPHWFEDDLLDMVERAFRASLNDDTETSYQILQGYVDVCDRLGAEWEVSYARRRADALSGFTLERVLQAAAGEADDVTSRMMLGLAERIAVLPMTAGLGLIKSIEGLKVQTLGERLRELDWNNPAAIYLLSLPAPLRERLEYLSKRLPFESQAEGRFVSPPWYRVQLVVSGLADALHANVREQIEWTSAYYPSVAGRLRDGKCYPHAAAVYTRGLEYYWKLIHHLEQLEATVGILDGYRVASDLPWPEWFWKDWRRAVDELAAVLHEGLAHCIPHLAGEKRRPDLPDFFGEAAHRVGEACFQSLAENNAKLFARLFPRYFFGVLAVVEKIRERTTDLDDLSSLAPFLAEPLMDLITVSGYAYAWSELHRNPELWARCKTVWDRYLGSLGAKAKDGIAFLAAVLRYRRSIFALTPRDVLRTRWQMTLNQAIRSLPHRLEDHGRIGLSTLPNHPSILIRLMGSSQLGSIYDGIDVFVSIYLRNLPDAAGVDFGRDFLTKKP